MMKPARSIHTLPSSRTKPLPKTTYSPIELDVYDHYANEVARIDHVSLADYGPPSGVRRTAWLAAIVIGTRYGAPRFDHLLNPLWRRHHTYHLIGQWALYLLFLSIGLWGVSESVSQTTIWVSAAAAWFWSYGVSYVWVMNDVPSYMARFSDAARALQTIRIKLSCHWSNTDKISHCKVHDFGSARQQMPNLWGRDGELSNYLELDNPVPLRDYGGSEQRLAPLCSNCHTHNSYLECVTPFQQKTPLPTSLIPLSLLRYTTGPKPNQAVQQSDCLPMHTH